MDDFVLLKHFNSIALAKLAKNMLEVKRVKSVLRNTGLEFPEDLGDSYGADLYVPEKQFKKAKEILETF